MIIKTATEAVGNTPLLCLGNLKKYLNLKSDIYAKLEFMNPAGSIKDRVAEEILSRAERKGLLNSGTTVIEATSGNTGIGLAFACACRGLKLIVVMPDSMSGERISLIKAYGAEVILTDAKLGMLGSIAEADRLASEYENVFLAKQFQNKANPIAHFRYTGPEIYKDLKNIDYFVAGVGTAGTITGVGHYLKEKIRGIKIIGVEPSGSPVLSGGQKGTHGIEGIGAGFLPPFFKRGLVDAIKTVGDEDAVRCALTAAKLEGCCVGVSSGANLHVCIDLAKNLRNLKIVTVFPDSGSRYISSKMFD